MGDIKICVIGAGRWGKNHIRTLFELGALGGVVDPDAQQRNKIKELFPGQSILIHLKMLFKQILIVILWLHPFKEHQLVVIGSKGSLHFEDSAENKPLLFYEKDSDPDLNLLSLKNKLSRMIEYKKTLSLTNEYFTNETTIINENNE